MEKHDELLMHNNIMDKMKNNPWRPTLIYMIIGLLWILFSDRALSLLIDDIALYETVQLVKGWFYVFATGLVIYTFTKWDNVRLFRVNKSLKEKNDELLTLTKDLKKQKDFVELIYENSNTAIFTWKLTGEIVKYNECFSDLFGYDGKIIGMNCLDLLVPEKEKDKALELHEILKENHEYKGVESKNVTSSGKVLDMYWNNVIVKNLDGSEEVISYGINMTGERTKEKENYELATIDSLTGLKNKTVFEVETNELINDNKDFTVYQLAVDNFKRLNDFHGFKYADRLLVKISKELQNIEGLNLYRWCGSKFLIVEETCESKTSDESIKKIRNKISSISCIEGLKYTPTVCIGVLESSAKDSLDDVYTKVNIALEQAKLSGKNQVEHYNEKFASQIRYNELMEIEISRALVNNEFVLNFQPIYCLNSNNIHTIEVLLRWPNNVLNEYNIGNVISLAERTGQILDIDKYVVDKVFSNINEYKDIYKDKIVSINISTQSFHSNKFYDFVIDKMLKYEINPINVEFEITEHSILENLDTSEVIMKRYKDSGFRMSLDDFGTKYSSLNYLSKLPFDVLKIDKSYVDNIVTNEKDGIIVKNIIRLSNELGLSTTAEGIESKEQLDVLKSIGCSYVQGYLMSRPLDIDTLVKVVDDRVGFD